MPIHYVSGLNQEYLELLQEWAAKQPYRNVKIEMTHQYDHLDERDDHDLTVWVYCSEIGEGAYLQQDALDEFTGISDIDNFLARKKKEEEHTQFERLKKKLGY